MYQEKSNPKIYSQDFPLIYENKNQNQLNVCDGASSTNNGSIIH